MAGKKRSILELTDMSLWKVWKQMRALSAVQVSGKGCTVLYAYEYKRDRKFGLIHYDSDNIYIYFLLFE